jgi:hypothetical protein
MVVSFPAGTVAVLKSAVTLRGLSANFNSFLPASLSRKDFPRSAEWIKQKITAYFV